MGDNNWDLSAVVRNCNINGPNDVIAPNLGLKTVENDDWNASDKFFVDDMPNFNSLSEIFSTDFSVAHQKKSNDQVIIMDQNDNLEMYLHPIQPNQFSQQIFLPPLPTTIRYVPTTSQELIDLQQQLEKSDDQVLIMDQNDNQEMYLHPIQPTQFSQQQQISLPPLSTTITCVPTTTTTPQDLIDLQQQPVMQDQVYPNFTMPMKTPLINTCKRKNQSTRVIYEVLQEELRDDKWTWRKYGQKSIKGLPFPRNYFRCSTSRSCEAKKMIEKSPKNENYFLVSYSGEHNHDPPTCRRSLPFYNSGFKYNIPKSISIVPKALKLNASSSSSKRAKRSRVDASSISLTTPTLEIESNNEMAIAGVENKGDGEEEENMYDNIFMEFEELDGVTASILWG